MGFNFAELKSSVSIDAVDPVSGKSVLRLAIESGDDETAAFLIKNGAQLKTNTNKHPPLLMLAAKNGLTRTVAAMVKNGANINKRFKADGGKTALHLAAEAGHVNTLQELLTLGANVKLKDDAGNAAIFYACKEGKAEVVDAYYTHKKLCFVDHKPEHFEALLLTACTGADDEAAVDTIKTLLRFGGSVVCFQKNTGNTMLHIAVERGHLNTVTYLLEDRNVVRHASNCNGETPRQLVDEQNVAMVKLFQPYSQSLSRNPAMLGSQKTKTPAINHSKIPATTSSSATTTTSTMPPYDAMAENREVTHQTLFFDAVSEQHIMKVSHLLRYCTAEIEPSALNPLTGISALRMAIESGNDELATLLVNSGVALKAVTRAKETPLMLAAGAGLTETVKAMIEKGAKSEKSFDNGDGRTAMHFAAKAGHSATIRALAGLGAAMNVADANGMTPLRLACQEGHLSAVNMLLDVIFHSNKFSIESIQLDACLLHACSVKNDSTAAAISKRLISLGANTNCHAAKSGDFPLQIAVAHGHIETATYLISHPLTRVDKMNKNGETAAFFVKENDQQMLSLLKRFGIIKD